MTKNSLFKKMQNAVEQEEGICRAIDTSEYYIEGSTVFSWAISAKDPLGKDIVIDVKFKHIFRKKPEVSVTRSFWRNGTFTVDPTVEFVGSKEKSQNEWKDLPALTSELIRKARNSRAF